jgi:hypothetical protein
VRDEGLSVLWLCGPPGAGKSAVGWALYAGLERSGAPAAFADIDQLGICLPAPPDDPQRHHVKGRTSWRVHRARPRSWTALLSRTRAPTPTAGPQRT